jgi:hypothetical protein
MKVNYAFTKQIILASFEEISHFRESSIECLGTGEFKFLSFCSVTFENERGTVGFST